MPKSAKYYVGAVITAGLLSLAVALFQGGSFVHPWMSLLYIACAIAASTVKLRLRGMPSTYSWNFLFILIGLYYFSPLETIVAGCLGVTVQRFWRAQTRPVAVQVIFNMANIAISVGTASALAYSPFLRNVEAYRPALMAAVVFVQFAVNTVVISGVLSILEGKSLREVCSAWYEWSFPCYMVGAGFVAALPVPGQSAHPEALLLLLPLGYLVHFFCGLGLPSGTAGAAGKRVSFSVGSLPGEARFYIGFIVSAGLLLLGSGLVAFDSSNLSRFAGYLLLGMLVSAWKVRLPGMLATISVGFVVTLVLIVELPFSQALVIALAQTLVQMLWKPKARPATTQIAFSAASLVICTAIAQWLVRGVLLGFLAGSLPATLAVAATVVYFLNTVMVSTAVCLATRQPLSRMWQNCYFWSFAYYLVGACVSGLMVLTGRNAGWMPSMLVMPIMGMVYVSYRLHVDKGAERMIGFAENYSPARM